MWDPLIGRYLAGANLPPRGGGHLASIRMPLVFDPGERWEYGVRWGLGYMLDLDPGPDGRSAGTVSWGGLFNTYYWLDPVRRVTGVILTQILPFADRRVLALYGRFERAIYEAPSS